jgi:hypothetical protein
MATPSPHTTTTNKGPSLLTYLRFGIAIRELGQFTRITRMLGGVVPAHVQNVALQHVALSHGLE